MPDKIPIEEEPARYIVNGSVLEIFGDVGKYISLIYGIYQVVKDEPNFNQVFVAGAGYFMASILSEAGTIMRELAIGKFVCDDLEKRLKK